MSSQRGYVLHACEDLPRKTVQVVFIRYRGDAEQRRWWLHLFWVANRKHVEEGNAEQVGELLEDHWLEILHCPFCGVSLYPRELD